MHNSLVIRWAESLECPKLNASWLWCDCELFGGAVQRFVIDNGTDAFDQSSRILLQLSPPQTASGRPSEGNAEMNAPPLIRQLRPVLHKRLVRCALSDARRVHRRLTVSPNTAAGRQWPSLQALDAVPYPFEQLLVRVSVYTASLHASWVA